MGEQKEREREKKMMEEEEKDTLSACLNASS